MIYIAGPLTDNNDAECNLFLYNFLANSGYHVFLPQKIGRNAVSNYPLNEDEKVLRRYAFYKSDIAAMNKCDICVANLHRECSSGTAFELGYMFAQQKACIILNTKHLSLKTLGTMLIGSCVVVNSYDDLARYLEFLHGVKK